MHCNTRNIAGHERDAYQTYNAHQNCPKLKMQLKGIWNYWPIMIVNCIDFTRRCQVYQYHGKYIRQPLKPLYPPHVRFHSLMHTVGPYEATMVRGYKYILEAID